MPRPRRSRHGHNDSDVGSRSGCKFGEPLRAEFVVAYSVAASSLGPHGNWSSEPSSDSSAELPQSQRTRRVRGKPIKHAGVVGGLTQHPSVRLASRDAAGRTNHLHTRLSHSGTTHSNRGEAPATGLTGRGYVLTVSAAAAGQTDAPCSTRWRVNGGRC